MQLDPTLMHHHLHIGISRLCFVFAFTDGWSDASSFERPRLLLSWCAMNSPLILRAPQSASCISATTLAKPTTCTPEPVSAQDSDESGCTERFGNASRMKLRGIGVSVRRSDAPSEAATWNFGSLSSRVGGANELVIGGHPAVF